MTKSDGLKPWFFDPLAPSEAYDMRRLPISSDSARGPDVTKTMQVLKA
jgi:hypothetical protein